MSCYSVENGKLVAALQNGFQEKNQIILDDIIDLYMQILLAENEGVDGDAVLKAVCKCVQGYCDLDEGMRESTRIISSAKESTQSALNAMKTNNIQAMAMAQEQFEEYQKRIRELESEMFTDEMTGVYNRRYLYQYKLDPDQNLMTRETVLVLMIEPFQEINQRFGYSLGDNILKYFVRNLLTLISLKNYDIIRMSGGTFVVFANEHQLSVLDRKLEGYKNALKANRFKTSSGPIEFNFRYGHGLGQEGDRFEELYKDIVRYLA